MGHTKEQKEIIRGELEQQAIARRKEYLLGVPKRLAACVELAKKLNIWVTVTLQENGPKVSFKKDEDPYFEDIGTYEMDEWELDNLEGRLIRAKEKADEKTARLDAAIDVWAKLTKEEREGIKENIDSLPK